MRRPTALILALSLMAHAATAGNVLDSHFGNPALPSSGCYVRDYSAGHLASHPDQLVKSISLGISPLSKGGRKPTLMVFAQLRGDDYHYSAAADCRTKGANLDCRLQHGAGRFTLSAEGAGSLRLTVGREGMAFAGGREPVISGTSGDDRVFVIPNVEPDFCG